MILRLFLGYRGLKPASVFSVRMMMRMMMISSDVHSVCLLILTSFGRSLTLTKVLGNFGTGSIVK